MALASLGSRLQYASMEFRSLLAEHQAGASMSRKGNCYDNAAMESFWATLKTECFGSYVPETKEQAKIMILDYIEGFYNRSRLHSALGYKSRLDFESPPEPFSRKDHCTGCSMWRLIWPCLHEHSTGTDSQGAGRKKRPALEGGFF